METPRYATATPDEVNARVAALQAMAVLDTPPEKGFDALARVAANTCGTPIAMVSLIDGPQLWFKSVVGVSARSIDSQHSFCCESANSKTLLEVTNARLDPRFAHNGLVAGELGIHCYAGAPIMYEGVGIGTVCVLDRVPRQWDARQRATLVDLACIATVMLRARIDAFQLFSNSR